VEVGTVNFEYCSIAWKNSTKKMNLLLQPGCSSEDSTKNYLISELLYCEQKNNPKHCKKEEDKTFLYLPDMALTICTIFPTF